MSNLTLRGLSGGVIMHHCKIILYSSSFFYSVVHLMIKRLWFWIFRLDWMLNFLSKLCSFLFFFFFFFWFKRLLDLRAPLLFIVLCVVFHLYCGFLVLHHYIFQNLLSSSSSYHHHRIIISFTSSTLFVFKHIHFFLLYIFIISQVYLPPPLFFFVLKSL